MPRCGFCGKQCPTETGLKRHIDRTSNCKKKSHDEFGQFANSIWDSDNIPANPDDVEQLAHEPDMLGFPDFELEEDIQLAEEALPPPPQQPPDEPQARPQRATINAPVNEEV